MKNNYNYESLDKKGFPYWRKSQTVGECPHDERNNLLQEISKILKVKKIEFGVSLYKTLGMHKKEALQSGNKFLLFMGVDMPLSLLNI